MILNILEGYNINLCFNDFAIRLRVAKSIQQKIPAFMPLQLILLYGQIKYLRLIRIVKAPEFREWKNNRPKTGPSICSDDFFLFHILIQIKRNTYNITHCFYTVMKQLFKSTITLRFYCLQIYSHRYKIRSLSSYF